MKRFCPGILILTFLWVYPSLAIADKTLRVGYFTKKPVAMADPSGEPSGLVVDILADIAKKQGWTLTWVHGSFSEGVGRLDAGEIDLMVPIAYTPARDAFLDFTKEAFLQSWGCLFTKRGSQLRSIPDTAGKRIAYVQRSMLYNEFKKMLHGFQIECEWIQVPSYGDLLNGLIAGRYDGGIGDRLAVMTLAQEQAAHIDGSIVFSPFGLRAAVPEGDPKRLLPLLDGYLSKGRLDAGSAYNQYLEKWFTGSMSREDRREVTLALVFGIVFFGFIGYLLFQFPRIRRLIRLKEIDYNQVAVNALVAAGLLSIFLYFADALCEYLWFNAESRSFLSLLLPLDHLSSLMMRAIFCSAILVAGIVTSRTLGLLAVQQRVTAEMAENLRLNEEKYRLYMENAHDGVLIVGSDQKFEYANSELSKILGYPLDKIIGHKFSEFLHPESIATVVDRYQRRQQGEAVPSRYELQIIRDNGEVRDIEISVGTTKDSKGEAKTIGSLLDITHRKKSEEEVRNAYNIINKSPYVVFLWQNTEEWPVEYASENVKTLFGYAAEDFVSGKTAYIECVHPNDLERVAQEVQHYSSNQDCTEFAHLPYRIVTRSGAVKWVEDLTHIRRNSQGKITHYEGIVYDVTNRKRAEDELQHLRNYLTNIIDSMPSVLIGVDSQGIVTQWNNQAHRVTGLPSRKAVGRPLDQAFPRLAAQMTHVREAMISRQVFTNPRQARHEDGETRYEDMTVYPLVANGASGAVIRVDDVTERVRIEEMMVQNEKMLSVGGLAAGMAHEINNPLAGMIQTATVMGNRLNNGELPANRKAAAEAGTTMEAIHTFMEVRGILTMLENIRQSGRRAAEIVANMLSFARKSNAAYTSQDLVQLLDQTLDLAGSDYDLKKKHDFRQIEIVREYADGIPPIPCEGAKIQQVILNLLRNGAEAMQDKAELRKRKLKNKKAYQPRFILRLAHEKEAGRVRIEIEDNGPGMDEATRKRVFEPFFTTKTIDRGTGLGLSVSYFIITENHGGEMSVKSIPEKGTTFIIKLPLEGKW